MTDWFYVFDLCGTSVFALSGALAARRHNMDPFGVIVLASVTAVGGGSIRDAILGATPVFWILDPNYLIVILMTVLLVFLCIKAPRKVPKLILPIADALGLALFTIIGIEKALNLELSGIIAVVMGLITGVGGGIIRDLLCQRVPMILRTEIYATASIFGGISYTICLYLGISEIIALAISMSMILAIRLPAIIWHISLPVFEVKK